MDKEQKQFRFLAAVIISLANQGNLSLMYEWIAQSVASLAISGDPGSELASAYSEISGRIDGLMQHQGQIWDELVSGPVRDDPEWDVLLTTVDAWLEGTMTTTTITAGDIPKQSDNIVLDYPVTIRRTGRSWKVDHPTFFVDEHGVQWVKFRHRDEEIMMRTEGIVVTRR